MGKIFEGRVCWWPFLLISFHITTVDVISICAFFIPRFTSTNKRWIYIHTAMQSGSVPNTITLKATSQEAFFFSLLPLATSSSFICHLLCYTRNTLLLYGSLKSARTSLRKEKAKAEMAGGFRRHRLFLPRLEDWSIHSLLLTALHMVLRSLAYASRRNRHSHISLYKGS